MLIKYGTYIQRAGTVSACHTINLRKADKFAKLFGDDVKVITLQRTPAKGEVYHLRFTLPKTTEEQAGNDLLKNWLLPRIRERQRAVM